MRRRRILLAFIFIFSTFLTLIVGSLSNLSTTYLAPIWAGNPKTIYVALAVTFSLSLGVSGYLFLKTLSSDIDSETPVTKKIGSTSVVQKSQDYVLPIPKINPLPNNISGKIAFLRGQGNDKEYIVANNDGSDEYVITKSSWSIHFPRIAPGGEKVVFVSAYEGRVNIYVVDQDGSNLKRLTEPGNARRNGYASWSPDAAKLIYTREYSIINDIYVMDSDGKNQINLTNQWGSRQASLNLFSEFPWSPDSQRIVFASNREGFLKLYVMDQDGKNLRQITNNSNGADYGAVWAPNENRIAYVSTGNKNGSTDIFTRNLRSSRSKPINLTNNPCRNTNPVWSPDGTQILFVSNRDGSDELYMMNSDGSDVKRITHSAEPKENASWLR